MKEKKAYFVVQLFIRKFYLRSIFIKEGVMEHVKLRENQSRNY